MNENLLKKIEKLEKIFSDLTQEAKYAALIELGKTLSPPPLSSGSLVPGCQSRLYLYAEFLEGKVFFRATADALISAGLAALLIAVYSGETPETILTFPPDFLKKLQIENALSPNRSNGLYQIHLRMKQEALQFLVTKS